MPPRHWIALALLALGLRLPAVLDPRSPTSDASDYVRLADAVRSGVGLVAPSGNPTAFRPPGYPLFLSAVGTTPLQRPVVAQVALGTLSCLLVARLALLITGSLWSTWLAGAMMALDPVRIGLCGVLLSENLYEVLLLACLTLIALPSQRNASWGVGLTLGLALLTRAAALPIVLVVCIWLWRQRPRQGRVVLATIILVVAPWLLRNWWTIGSPVLTTQGGITLYSSCRPPNGRILGVLVHDDVVAEAQKRGEVAADRELTRKALHCLVQAPVRSLRLAALKVAFLWVPIDWEVLSPAGRVTPVFLFAMPLGILAMGLNRTRYALAVALLVGVTAFSAVVYGSPRLRLPYEPLLFVAAADMISRRPHSAWILWALACLCLYWSGESGKLVFRGVGEALGLW